MKPSRTPDLVEPSNGGLAMLAHTNSRVTGLTLLLAGALLVLPVSTRSLPGVLGHLPVGTSDARGAVLWVRRGLQRPAGRRLPGERRPRRGDWRPHGGDERLGQAVPTRRLAWSAQLTRRPRERWPRGGVVGGLAQQCYRGVCRAVGAIPGLAGGGYRSGSPSYGAAQVNAANRVMQSGYGSSGYRPTSYGSSGSGSYGLRGGRRY